MSSKLRKEREEGAGRRAMVASEFGRGAESGQAIAITYVIRIDSASDIFTFARDLQPMLQSDRAQVQVRQSSKPAVSF